MMDPLCLAAALEAGGIFHRVPATDVRSAMAAAAERLPLSASDRATAAARLLEREADRSTALGRGIAVPHPRSPLVFPVERQSLTLCFLERPVDFGAADRVPVSVLFVPLAVTMREHLGLLAGLAAALKEPGFRDLVLGQAAGEEILRALKGRR